jgi:Polyketide cyclase / dehydrase and lipid transport
MRSVQAVQTFAADVADAERCWYDTGRWPAWIDGCDRVAAVRAPWPQAGGAVTWESGPAGRGTVTETVTGYEPGRGQTVEVADDSVTGRQTVTFTSVAGGVEVTLGLTYQLRRTTPITVVIDLLFIRRQMTMSLTRTLSRFGAHLRSGRTPR